MTTQATFQGALSRNPVDGSHIAEYPFDDEKTIAQTISNTHIAAREWGQFSVEKRAAKLRDIAQVLRLRRDDMASVMSREMGKPIKDARAEVEKSARLCDWYAEHGPAMLSARPTQVPDQRAVIEFKPLGVILGVMPWNFPLWQVLRGAIPTLLAGNGYVLKHAPNVMGSAFFIRELMADANLPEDLFSVINASNDGVSQAIKDDRISAVAFTGSGRAGGIIGSLAGAALKKSILELGGSDPFIVLKDADIDAAVVAGVTGRYSNCGQVCAAAKRFIVDQHIAEEFTHRFVDAVKALKVGDPRDEATQIGPMARFDLRDELDDQIQATIAQGATVLTGGAKRKGEGNYYEPTVLANVTPEMTAFRQELFGPVATITVARDENHAVELANDSEFGLSASIFSGNEDNAVALAERLETGSVFINGYSISDPRAVFGGVKKSGYGRELTEFGLHEFCNVRTLWKRPQA